MSIFKTALFILLSTLLAACGGGGATSFTEHNLKKRNNNKLTVKHASLSLFVLVIAITGSFYSTRVYSNGGIMPSDYLDAALINDGRDIFLYEEFDGNGRTCGSCHLEDNNFTIDPRAIAKLPEDDPLFLAEREGDNPLAEDFEKPDLMRKLGLILANTNGFDDLEHSFTMRSVPHMLAMRTSITPPGESAALTKRLRSYVKRVR